MSVRPEPSALVGDDVVNIPMSLQRISAAQEVGERFWISSSDAVTLDPDVLRYYQTAHAILMRLCIEAPLLHASGHPGGPLSAFTCAYLTSLRRNPATDQTLRFSAGHLSLLGFALEWFFGRDHGDPRLASPQAIAEAFRTVSGLPGHVEAGIGDIPFGTGPLGKGVSNALGVAFGQQYLKKSGVVDVLLADGDSQEGQVLEAFRLASVLKLDHLIVHGDWNDVQLSGLPSRTMATDLPSIAAAMGWSVIEVQNGNDPGQVFAALDRADTLVGKGKPIFVCYYTTMGYGVRLMEEGSNTGKKNFHGAPLSAKDAAAALRELQLPPLDVLARNFEPLRQLHKEKYESARRLRTSSILPFSLPADYRRSLTVEPGAARKDFGSVHLKSLMDHDPRIIVLHADLAESGGFGSVAARFPHRVVNVGVAEANMYMMAAGMRQTGLLPVTYTFAAFGTNEARANARLIDVNTGHIPLGVLHDCTHAGLSVGEDGETHQERNYVNLPFDHTQVWVPGDSNQAGAMAERGLEIIAQGADSIFVFSARSNHPQLLDAKGEPLYGSSYVFDHRATVVRGYGDVRDSATIISYGAALHEAVKAADILASDKRIVRVLNCASIRPLDSAAIIQAVFETQHLIVVEDHHVEGGLATQIADLIADLSLPCTLRRLGVRHYFPSAPADQLMILAGIDVDSIVSAVEDQFALRLAQGEEIFVACVYGLPERLRHSRFAPMAYGYLQRLSRDNNALLQLREMWKLRSLPANQLPTTRALQSLLSALRPIDHVNTLTGLESEKRQDLGIV